MKEYYHLPIILSLEEINHLLSFVDDIKYKAILSLLYGSGLRVSEAVSLDYCDISRRNMTVHALFIQKNAPHTLRHAFATHLLENGVEFRYIQTLLGHRDPKSTEVYLHLSNKTVLGITSPFDREAGDIHG